MVGSRERDRDLHYTSAGQAGQAGGQTLQLAGPRAGHSQRLDRGEEAGVLCLGSQGDHPAERGEGPQ